MKFLFKYASRGRPVLFFEILNLYINMMSGKHSYQFICSFDREDELMNASKIREKLAREKYSHIKYFYGDNEDKIDAINADMEHADDFDILIVVSDDMRPALQDYDAIIARDMRRHFPQLDGALHYHDGLCGKDITITLSIMGKALYDYFGYIYHPDYKSFYCDNEFTDVVKKLGKHAYIPLTPIKHCYFGFAGKADATYKMNSKKGAPDAATYARRKKEGFPL